jgi:hypothetical protein
MPLRSSLFSIAFLAFTFAIFGRFVSGDEPTPLPAIDAQVGKLTDGFVAVRWQPETGKVIATVDAVKHAKPFLLVTSLVSGLGSNPVGLDRGQIRQQRLVRWERVGRRAMLRQLQTDFRASGTIAEQAAVAQSFASSVLFIGDIVAEQDDNYAVDITGLLVRDDDGIARQLKESGEEGYSLSKDQSLPLPDQFRSFMKNTELDALLTFVSDSPGRLTSQVAPDASVISLQKRVSMIELPTLGDYTTRVWHPHSGAIRVNYIDYSAPLDDPMEQNFLIRHRVSIDNPIVYYVDHAAPQPIRDALVEGASWWAEAFDSAGLKGAYRVEVLPTDVDPLDVRYNVIQWVHRRTRGWSYGNSVVDPRTGEILKGHVSLGSLRVRQDRRLLNNMPSGLPPEQACSAGCCGVSAPDFSATIEQIAAGENATEVSLARIRQLAAHEVGHTLGFAHNFAASTYDRASVMDYPAPLIRLSGDGSIDLSEAYGVGIGRWDKWSVQFAYGPESNRDALLKQAYEENLIYLTDSDARPAGAAEPRASLWDNGNDTVAELVTLLEVRKKAIDSFGLQVLSANEPLSNLEISFVPLYLMHRYQVDAVAKQLGGRQYRHGLRSDFPNAEKLVSDVDAGTQQAALAALLKTIEPETLRVPERIVKLMQPSAVGSAMDRERFTGFSDPMFDPIAAAVTAADVTFEALTDPHRAARMNSTATAEFGFPILLIRVSGLLFQENDEPEDLAAIRRALRQRWVDHLITLHRNDSARTDVRAAVLGQLMAIQNASSTENAMDDEIEIRQTLDVYLNRSQVAAPAYTGPKPAPPGSPIGDSGGH